MGVSVVFFQTHLLKIIPFIVIGRRCFDHKMMFEIIDLFAYSNQIAQINKKLSSDLIKVFASRLIHWLI